MVENNTGTNPPVIRVTWSMSRATTLKVTVNNYLYTYTIINKNKYTRARIPFHDVYCSKPLTFHNGFRFLCFSYLFQALLQISSPHSSDRQKKMSITRFWRQQRMCSVWYTTRKGNGRQPDNICYLTLNILSKNKACDCYRYLILIVLEKICNCYCSLIRNCRLKKNICLLVFCRGW